MESQEPECVDPSIGAEIEMISHTEDLDLTVQYYTGEPGFLRYPREHWPICAYCKGEFPNAMTWLDSIESKLRERALQRLEQLREEYAAEFSSIAAEKGKSWQYSDQIAALASTYSAPAMWELSFLLPEPAWKTFTVLPGASVSGEEEQLGACWKHLAALSPEALRFLFTAVLANELHLQLFRKFWRMELPVLFRAKPDGARIESYDNPDYPIYQAYEMRMSMSRSPSGRDGEEEPLYGGPIALGFIREKLRETLLETPLDYHALLATLERAAAGCLQDYQEHGAEAMHAHAEPNVESGAMPSGLSRKLGELSSDLNDGLDSLRAGQMELRLAIEKGLRSADTFLPLVESRLGVVYGRLHPTTKRLLALGEYFRSLNLAEPDAMNVVVLHQAKACEHELYARIFFRYMAQLRADGVKDYLVDGTCKSPLLKQGKEVPRSMALANYCWYLKHDFKLQEWIRSNFRFSLSTFIDEAYWLSEQRNLAAHENEYREYDLAVFHRRLFSPNGLLSSLHSKA